MLVKYKNINFLTLVLLSLLMTTCGNEKNKKVEVPFIWEAANVYFMLTDRFHNGDTSNDINFGRDSETGVLRGFEGGDLRGITQKIEEGYFDKLGVNAIWMTPLMEQVHGFVDEGTGITYGYHGYWMKDWTVLDPNFGTKEDLKRMIEVAHAHGIRVLLDAVINHTGPSTELDSAWENEWVRTSPACTYKNYETTVSCTLVENLLDIKTELNEDVALPKELVEKWKLEGRYEKEIAELNVFFERTGLPKAPRFYIMKWLTDYIEEFGIDGYRVDTVKHTEESVWKEFKELCNYSFGVWKKNNPKKVLDNNDFFTVAEVYNFNISTATAFDFGDKKVNYYENGFNSVINFEFKYNAKSSYEELFSRYSAILSGDLKEKSIMNYFSSHDDGQPFDARREKNYVSAIKLLLTPGISQIYYGDESDRPLIIDHTNGDATLRSFMNWDAVKNNEQTQKKVAHWGKLGNFRIQHPSVGAGKHEMISQKPYSFSRTFKKDAYEDMVVIGLDQPKGGKILSVGNIFENGAVLIDEYSNIEVVVKNGSVEIDSPFDIVLLALKN